MKRIVFSLLGSLLLTPLAIHAEVTLQSFEVIDSSTVAQQSAEPVDPITEATRAWAAGQPARVIETPAMTLVPHGQAPARLECLPLRVCLIELEAGETLLSTVAGDAERWTIQPTFGGTDGKTPIVAVKPQNCDLATNLVLLTTRRIYDVELRSPSCEKPSEKAKGKASSGAGVIQGPHRIRFYYPEDLVRVWARRDAAREAHAEDPSRVALAEPLPLDRLNFRYRWKRNRLLTWTPERIFDDGERTYLQFPESARRGDAPLLFVVDSTNKSRDATELVNVVIQGDFYIADRTFERAVLVTGTGRGKRELAIENLAKRRAQ